MPNQGITLPTVLANVSIDSARISVEFIVEEPINCFRAEVTENNGHCWEDSCVEIFVQDPAGSGEYFNFETTSRGFMLAAHGPDREHRQTLPLDTIDKIRRTKQKASVVGDLVCWAMSIEIPAEIFGLARFDGIHLRGNLYKCADKAKTPHYLSAFPIQTERPDFHRPEFFKEF
ncbi:carbohydrate-binding family 9-like protein [uncultured Fibrobacter sp.]|uniref:carbohydrate-binding family 9-like protein n=1 Tax=uncultured Fibrobacter sp. TaxID=261512 RepID=UPI002638A296|nr:carbohydrate-binding family 9-like protein [uncultured Fibrobacter sp.]